VAADQPGGRSAHNRWWTAGVASGGVLIIDAYNVLHTRGVLPPDLAGPGVPELVRLIGQSRYARRSVSVVCDGTGAGSSGVRMGDVRIVFAGRHQEADDVIEAMIRRFTHGRSLVVVSSDRRLRRAARRHGAVSLASAAFLAELAEDWGRGPSAKRGGVSPVALRVGPPLDPYSVEAWMREFGVEPPAVERDALGGEGAEIRQSGRRTDEKKQQTKPAPPAFGDRLEVPAIEPPAERVERVDVPLSGEAVRASAEAGDDQGGIREEDLDPVLRAALEEWRDRLTLDDLDMRRWLPDIDPMC
jgi:predicted RNA-binding protein with PIN domain